MKETIDTNKSAMDKVTFGRTNFAPAVVSMIEEGGFGFLSYLTSLGIAKEPNLMVLSSKHHYFYDESDLKEIKTLVNIMKMNLVRHPDRFLETLARILPQESGFIGCFTDTKSAGRMFLQPSRMLYRFTNILDSRPDRSLNQNQVSELLASRGFKIIDMQEIDGVTYFYAKPAQKPSELRA